MVAARNLGFSNSNFLTAKAVKGPILYQHAKFFEDRSTFHRDIAFFRFSNMAAAAICIFKNS